MFATLNLIMFVFLIKFLNLKIHFFLGLYKIWIKINVLRKKKNNHMKFQMIQMISFFNLSKI